MRSGQEQTERIKALEGLLDRLCAPDLTLGEAKDLRDRLSTVLGRDRVETQSTPRPKPSTPSWPCLTHPVAGTEITVRPSLTTFCTAC